MVFASGRGEPCSSSTAYKIDNRCGGVGGEGGHVQALDNNQFTANALIKINTEINVVTVPEVGRRQVIEPAVVRTIERQLVGVCDTLVMRLTVYDKFADVCTDDTPEENPPPDIVIPPPDRPQVLGETEATVRGEMAALKLGLPEHVVDIIK